MRSLPGFLVAGDASDPSGEVSAQTGYWNMRMRRDTRIGDRIWGLSMGEWRKRKEQKRSMHGYYT